MREEMEKEQMLFHMYEKTHIREEGESGQAGTSSGKSRRVLLQRVVTVRPGMPVGLLSVLFSQPETGEYVWVP